MERRCGIVRAHRASQGQAMLCMELSGQGRNPICYRAGNSTCRVAYKRGKGGNRGGSEWKKANVRRGVIITVSLLLCGIWFFLTSAWEGNQFHMHVIIDSQSLILWIVGWISI